MTASICSSPGREGDLAFTQTSGGEAVDARTGGDAEDDARQMSYTQVRPVAATNPQPMSMGGFVADADLHRGAGLGGVASGVEGVREWPERV